MRRKFLWFTVALFLIPPIAALAQITVTSSDVLGLIGKSQILEDDTTGNNITVNVGTAGANRTWDFRSLVLQTEKSTNQFIAPAGTPFAASFPQANFVVKTTAASKPDSSFYLYLQVSSDSLRTLGSGVVTPDTSFSGFLGAQNLSPLPLQFGSTWTSVESDTFGEPPLFAIIITGNSNSTVDAWGRVNLPNGDFDCLRIRDNNVIILKTIILGMTSSDTNRTIDYTWVSKADFAVASVSSLDGETNPNYTTATSFSRLFSRTTSVASPRANADIPAGFALAQNFPNPFNPETEISFEITRAEQTELSIYNIAGEKVRMLVSGIVQPGNYSIKWDGKDSNGQRLASGAYVYRLKVGALQKAKKMVLLQ